MIYYSGFQLSHISYIKPKILGEGGPQSGKNGTSPYFRVIFLENECMALKFGFSYLKLT